MHWPCKCTMDRSEGCYLNASTSLTLPAPLSFPSQASRLSWDSLAPIILPEVFHELNNLFTVASGYVGLMSGDADAISDLAFMVEEIGSASQRGERLVAAVQLCSSRISNAENRTDLTRVLGALTPLVEVLTRRWGTAEIHPHSSPVFVSLPAPVLSAILLSAVLHIGRFSPEQIRLQVNPPSSTSSCMVCLTWSSAEAPFDLSAEGFASREMEELGCRVSYTADATGRSIAISVPLEVRLAAAIASVVPDAAAKERRRALIIDGPDEVALLTASWLDDEGFAVTVAADPTEALRIVEADQRPFEFILARPRMRELSGTQFAQELQRLSPLSHLLLIVSNGEAGATNHPAAFRLLHEPLNREDLMTAVRSYRSALPSKRRILIADDDRAVRLWIRNVLASEGYELLEAEDGARACEVLQDVDCDLLLLDLMMPEKEGLETIQSICRHHHRLKLVAMSGACSDLLRVARLLGADEAISKPIRPEDLRSLVRKVLAA
jgi:CheY-like chemotaxis protein